MSVTVANKYHPGVVGGDITRRSSVLGNPFSHKDGTLAKFRVADRAAAVAAYRPWLKEQMRLGGPVLVELERLVSLARSGDLVLVCVCAPLACHGDVVRDAILFILANPDWRTSAVAAAKPPGRRP
jgi:hypothetical protein